MDIYYRLLFVRSFFLGIFWLFYFCFQKKRGEIVILLCPSAMGDDVYSLAYVHELKNIHKKKIVIYAGNNHTFVYDCFRNSYDSIVLFDINSLKWKGICRIGRSHILTIIARSFGIYNAYPFLLFPPRKNDGRDVLSIIRSNLLCLPDNAKIKYPLIKKVNINLALESPKIAVLNPYSSSMINVDQILFQDIAIYLRAKGYSLYTSVVGNQMPIKGTERLEMSVMELCSFCNEVKPLFVSVRTGLLDMCISTNALFYVFYFPFTKSQYFHYPVSGFYSMYTLSAWKTSNVVEHIYQSKAESFMAFESFMEKTIK